MIVYRMERSGFGVFSNPNRKLLDDGTAMYSAYSCTIKSASFGGKQRFACESIDKLIEYWGTDFAHLLGQDFEIVAYKVRKNYVNFSPIAGLECAFTADKAVRI